MSTDYALRARIERTLDEAAELWDALGLAEPAYAFAVHAGAVQRCAQCGAWGGALMLGDGTGSPCAHPSYARRDRPCYMLTTLGGEVLPLTDTITGALQRTALWLVGHTLSSIGPGPAYSPASPLEIIYLVQHLSPTIRETTVLYTPLRTRLPVRDLLAPLVWTTAARPRCLPP